MTTKTLAQWSKSVLPDNFKQVSHHTLVIQQFLMEHLPEPVNQQVSVINFSSKEIVLKILDDVVVYSKNGSYSDDKTLVAIKRIA